jgi:hypothetical protein
MIRIDLDACGIPYVIEGNDGPLHADFHCLRHSFVSMLDKSGATLKEAMQLARHSDPRLTMAVYGRARFHDLSGAVDRLPSFSEPPTINSEQAVLKATGTDGPARLPFPYRDDDLKCQTMTQHDAASMPKKSSARSAQLQAVTKDDATCRAMNEQDDKDADRSRTDFEPGCSRLPCRPAPAS